MASLGLYCLAAPDLFSSPTTNQTTAGSANFSYKGPVSILDLEGHEAKVRIICTYRTKENKLPHLFDEIHNIVIDYEFCRGSNKIRFGEMG